MQSEWLTFWRIALFTAHAFTIPTFNPNGSSHVFLRYNLPGWWWLLKCILLRRNGNTLGCFHYGSAGVTLSWLVVCQQVLKWRLATGRGAHEDDSCHIYHDWPLCTNHNFVIPRPCFYWWFWKGNGRLCYYKCMYLCIYPISAKYWLYLVVCVAKTLSDENSQYFQYDGKASLFVAEQRHHLLLKSVTWHNVLIKITPSTSLNTHMSTGLFNASTIGIFCQTYCLITCEIVLYCVTVCNKEETKLQWNGWSQWENQSSECQACLGRPQLSAELVSHSTIWFLLLSDDDHWLAPQKVQRYPRMWTTFQENCE